LLAPALNRGGALPPGLLIVLLVSNLDGKVSAYLPKKIHFVYNLPPLLKKWRGEPKSSPSLLQPVVVLLGAGSSVLKTVRTAVYPFR
jgi:hypothetical protein